MQVSAAMSSPYRCQFEGFCGLCAHLRIPSGVEGFGWPEPDAGFSVHSADFVTLIANPAVPMSFLPAGLAGRSHRHSVEACHKSGTSAVLGVVKG